MKKLLSYPKQDIFYQKYLGNHPVRIFNNFMTKDLKSYFMFKDFVKYSNSKYFY